MKKIIFLLLIILISIIFNKESFAQGYGQNDQQYKLYTQPQIPQPLKLKLLCCAMRYPNGEIDTGTAGWFCGYSCNRLDYTEIDSKFCKNQPRPPCPPLFNNKETKPTGEAKPTTEETKPNISQNAVCCAYYPGSLGPGAGSIPPSYKWFCNSCPSGYPYAWKPVQSGCTDKPPDCSGKGVELQPGKVEVTWTPTTVSICPPGILGSNPCQYPSLEYLIKRINELLTLTVAPLALVILIIIGGLMYLLTPFGVEKYIEKGSKYIKYAIFGFIILLLTTLIFSIISAILGGP